GDVRTLGGVFAVHAVGGADDGEDGADLGLLDGDRFDAADDLVGLIDRRAGGHAEGDVDDFAVAALQEDEGDAPAGDHAKGDDRDADAGDHREIAVVEGDTEDALVAGDEQVAEEALARRIHAELQALEEARAAGDV